MVERFTVKGWNDDHIQYADPDGKWVHHSDYAELAAENARLKKALSEQIDRDISGIFPTEALSRTGAVKMPIGEIEEIVSDLEYWSERLADMRQPQGQSSLKHAASILSVLEPAAPEGRQEAVAERKFALGDRVTKTKGSSWTGRVVGFYSTTLTPIGYSVESENEPGSVQIYPEAALAQKEEG